MSSMFTVAGQVVNVFDQPGTLDKETGEMSPTTHRLQLLGNVPVQNGETRLDMITVKVDDRKIYENLKGKNIRLPIGVFSPGKNQIVYYVPKGSKPEVC
jgi:hypothetical protein